MGCSRVPPGALGGAAVSLAACAPGRHITPETCDGFCHEFIWLRGGGSCETKSLFLQTASVVLNLSAKKFQQGLYFLCPALKVNRTCASWLSGSEGAAGCMLPGGCRGHEEACDINLGQQPLAWDQQFIKAESTRCGTCKGKGNFPVQKLLCMGMSIWRLSWLVLRAHQGHVSLVGTAQGRRLLPCVHGRVAFGRLHEAHS